MRRRKEYLRRVPYKKAVGGRKLAKGVDGNKTVRNLLIGFPVVLLAAVIVILAVRGCTSLSDNAVGIKSQKLALAYAEQQGTGTSHGVAGSNPKENSGVKDNAEGNFHEDGGLNGNGSSGGSDSEVNSPNGGGVNLVGTDNTPSPAASPSPLPSPSPEPTTNGHELDNEMVIAIDAGHGGYDGGSVVGSVVEKDVNLAVAQEIARLLEEHGGITVVQTRDSDEHLSLQERCDIGNEAKCDYFVSVHCNTYGDDSSVRGFECHYNEKSSEGASFAQSVTNEMKQYKDMKIRSVKPNNLAVTVHTYCPAILIEMGFLTNPTDCANLTDSDYQKQLAERITKAVLKAAGL